MNYGYDNETPLWKDDRKQQLADRLASELSLPIAHRYGLPYIEVDGLYDGVRIRRITDLPDEAWKTMRKTADEVYQEVMRDNL